jgi:RNA polymerase sigma-70 factor (family 1)
MLTLQSYIWCKSKYGMYLSFTDEALMALLKQNDTVALKTIFNRYYKSLCQFCSVYTKDHFVAEEIVSGLFIKLWDIRNDVEILHLKHYLFVSAKNLSLNHIQKKKDPVELIEDIEFNNNMLQDRDTPFNILSGRESCNDILRMIDKLPASQRQVLLMTRVDNLDKYEVARILGISVRTVETTLYQSIKKLRQILNDHPNFTREI